MVCSRGGKTKAMREPAKEPMRAMKLSSCGIVIARKTMRREKKMFINDMFV